MVVEAEDKVVECKIQSQTLKFVKICSPRLIPGWLGIRPGWMTLRGVWMDGQMDGQMDGRTVGQRDGGMDGQTDNISPFYRTSSPIEAAVLLPPMKRNIGTLDHRPLWICSLRGCLY